MKIEKFKKITNFKGIDLFDEKTLLNHKNDSISSLDLTPKKQKTALARQGLGILTSRASLYGTYLSVILSFLMLLIYHHLSAFIPMLLSILAVASRFYMMRYFAKFARWENDFGKKHKYAIYPTLAIITTMIWLIGISLWGGINLIGYLFAVIFAMMTVVSGFVQLIYFVRMNDIDVAKP